MADIFNEVDEELRSDQLRKLWDKYSGLVIAVAVLIVVVVAGWRGWEYWQDRVARAAGDKYLAALELSDKGDSKAAEAALDVLAKESSGYAPIARLRAAGELSLAGDQPGALAAFDVVAKDKAVPSALQGIAALRAAYLALDLEDRPTVERRIAPFLTSGNPWRHAAREISAVAAWKAGDIEAAKKVLGEIESDQETPPDISRRTTVLSALIASASKKSAPAATPAAPSAPAAPDATPAAPSAAAAPDATPATPSAPEVPAATAPAPTAQTPEPATPPAPVPPATKAE